MKKKCSECGLIYSDGIGSCYCDAPLVDVPEPPRMIDADKLRREVNDLLFAARDGESKSVAAYDYGRAARCRGEIAVCNEIANLIDRLISEQEPPKNG